MMVEKSITIPAQIANWNALYDLLNAFMREHKISSSESINHIITACEEIFVNISRYAYPKALGDVTVTIKYFDDKKCVEIKFIDKGIRFDPTKSVKPDIRAGIEKRKIGGLGIFIARKFMDSMEYSYFNGKNHLVMTKRIK